MANDCRPSKNKIKKKAMLVHDEKEDDSKYRHEMTFWRIIKNKKKLRIFNTTSLL